MLKTIGVLALQGGFAKHIQMLQRLGVKTVEVRAPQDLASCEGMIIPGGESTVMMKQLQFSKLLEPLQSFAKEKPLFGTCAGLILMSSEILSDPMQPLQLLDIHVERNAFGRQVESFQTNIALNLPSGKSSAEAIFIRAPRIKKVGASVKVLAKFEGEPVLVLDGHHLGATFHPELTLDPTVHMFFRTL